MSYWRWLLFAAMARFEVDEDSYLRIPKAKTIRRDIAIEIYPLLDASDWLHAFARLGSDPQQD